MPDRQQLEALFLAHLELIERMLVKVARSTGLRGADADDFASWAKLRLVEDDYRILSRARDPGALAGFLATAVARLARDYWVQEHGRWRPSAAALQEGPLAVRLERLVYRNGHSLDEAAEVLRSSEDDVPSMRELADLLRRLPRRTPLRPRVADGSAADEVPGPDDAEARIARAETEASQLCAERALARALDRLDDEDRVIVRLRFWEGSSVADIARALGLPQPPLYRRLAKLMTAVRQAVEAEGVGPDAVRDYLAADSREVRRPVTREPAGADAPPGRSDAGRSVLPFPLRTPDP